MENNTMNTELFNVHVIWSCDGVDFFCTLLQYEDSDTQRQAMQQWSVRDYVEQAYDTEYPGQHNLITDGGKFECVTIFEGDVRYILNPNLYCKDFYRE